MKEHEFHKFARYLISVGNFFYQKGWIPAISGTFSARVDEDCFIITVSRRLKDELDEGDLVLVDMQGKPLQANKSPSPETPLHLHMYQQDADIGSILHTHSLHATVLSSLNREAMQFSHYEVLKSFATQPQAATVPIFPNEPDMQQLIEIVQTYRQRHPETLGFLLAGHGFYTWGKSIREAQRHIEAFEFLFECEVMKRVLAGYEQVLSQSAK